MHKKTSKITVIAHQLQITTVVSLSIQKHKQTSYVQLINSTMDDEF